MHCYLRFFFMENLQLFSKLNRTLFDIFTENSTCKLWNYQLVHIHVSCSNFIRFTKIIQSTTVLHFNTDDVWEVEGWVSCMPWPVTGFIKQICSQFWCSSSGTFVINLPQSRFRALPDHLIYYCLFSDFVTRGHL